MKYKVIDIEIRDIKIDLLMGNQNPILDLFNEITDGLSIIKCDVYNTDGSEFIYYNKENEWIFYQDVKNGEFWAHYNRYWEIFNSEFRLKYEEIQALTKFLVEEALKREVTTPVIKCFRTHFWVEEALKREVTTPYLILKISDTTVEEALKREVSTPLTCNATSLAGVEEALRREMTIPSASNVRLAIPIFDSKGNVVRVVEDALKRSQTQTNL